MMEENEFGYIKKIRGQVKGLSNSQFKTYLYVPFSEGLSLYEFDNQNNKFKKIWSKKYNFDFNKVPYKILNKLIKDRFKEFANGIEEVNRLINPDIVYIRRITPITYRLLSIIKKYRETGTIVVYEYPTYPWKEEMIKARWYLNYIIDRVHYKKLVEMVNIVTVMLGADMNLPEKFVSIRNGIDLDDIPLKNDHQQSSDLNLIAVANVMFWHGYDRVIEGLKNYYMTKGNSDENVYFHIVGDGFELPNLKSMAEKYGLKEKVIFHGKKVGKDLNEIFDQCDIAMGSFGLYRQKLNNGLSLKIREYCARGIPIVTGNKDKDLANFNYVYQFSNDETPIDIKKIIDFYNSIKSDNYKQKIRKYAENNLTWNIQMKPVIDKLKSLLQKK